MLDESALLELVQRTPYPFRDGELTEVRRIFWYYGPCSQWYESAGFAGKLFITETSDECELVQAEREIGLRSYGQGDQQLRHVLIKTDKISSEIGCIFLCFPNDFVQVCLRAEKIR